MFGLPPATTTKSNPGTWNAGHYITAALISVAALGLAATHIVRPDVKIDDTALGLLAMAALPWLAPLLAPYVKTIKGPGGTEVDFQGLVDKVDQANVAANSAADKAEVALLGATTGGPALVSPPGVGTVAAQSATTPDDMLRQLVRKYDELRSAQQSSFQRTKAMTELVSQLIKLAPALTDFDAAKSIASSSPGSRLAAYAYEYALPQPHMLDSLVDTISSLDAPGRFKEVPFNQYWGIQAIGRILALISAEQISATAIEKLNKFLKNLEPAADRHYELSRILEALQSGT